MPNSPFTPITTQFMLEFRKPRQHWADGSDGACLSLFINYLANNLIGAVGSIREHHSKEDADISYGAAEKEMGFDNAVKDDLSADQFEDIRARLNFFDRNFCFLTPENIDHNSQKISDVLSSAKNFRFGVEAARALFIQVGQMIDFSKFASAEYGKRVESSYNDLLKICDEYIKKGKAA